MLAVEIKNNTMQEGISLFIFIHKYKVKFIKYTTYIYKLIYFRTRIILNIRL